MGALRRLCDRIRRIGRECGFASVWNNGQGFQNGDLAGHGRIHEEKRWNGADGCRTVDFLHPHNGIVALHRIESVVTGTRSDVGDWKIVVGVSNDALRESVGRTEGWGNGNRNPGGVSAPSAPA